MAYNSIQRWKSESDFKCNFYLWSFNMSLLLGFLCKWDFDLKTSIIFLSLYIIIIEFKMKASDYVILTSRVNNWFEWKDYVPTNTILQIYMYLVQEMVVYTNAAL